VANGYVGRVAFVDLEEKKVVVDHVDWDIAASYIGGRGYAARLVYDHVPASADPLSEKNIVVLATGPITGTLAPTSGRMVFSGISPLTNTVFDSNVGGVFGALLKRGGFDIVVIRGVAETPVFLNIYRGRIDIEDAGGIWGKDTVEATRHLRQHYPGSSVAAIGPAGENRVRFACIMVDGRRAAGRGGLGAVLGAKRVKAIVVRGRGVIAVANSYAFRKEVKRIREILGRNPITGFSLRTYGTATLMHVINRAGILPHRNFRTGFWQEAEALSGEEVTKHLQPVVEACYACPIGCGRTVVPRKGRFAGQRVGSPEYESLWALGVDCAVADLDEVVNAIELCNRLGLDTISTGAVIAFAMEAREQGYLKEGPRWGDAHAIQQLIEDIAYRRELGDLLAEGSMRAAEQLGCPDLAMHVKGLELPAYDPRGAKGMGLAYATSNRGGCHLRAYLVMSEVLSVPRFLDPLTIEGKARLVKLLQDVFAVLDSMVVCKYTALALFDTLEYEPRFYARLLTTATGFYVDEEEFRLIGERIYNLERFINVERGFDRRHDTLPRRFLEVPLPEGPAAGQVVLLDRMLDEYYRLRGWDPQGVPMDGKLIALGIIHEPRWPKLQVALDLRNLTEAVRIAKACYAVGVDWIEVGTPLVKSAGMEAVRAIKRACPHAVVIADLKTLDTGWLETELAAQAGADIVSIAGLASDHTIRDAVGCARRYGVKIMVDLIEVADPAKRAKQLEALGVDYICVHSGIDAQRDRAQEIDRKVQAIGRVVRTVRIPVAVAGGIRLNTVDRVLTSGAKIIIVGAAITRAGDPAAAAKAFLKRLARYRERRR